LATLLLGVQLFAAPTRADDVALPIPLQVELLAKVVGYDRNMPERAGDRVRVLIVTKPGKDASLKVASQVERALADRSTIAGLPHEEATVPFSDARALAQLCRARRAGLVYFTPGFTDAEIASVATALEGVDVFTAGAMASFVPLGIVLGFDLVSGKPKLLVHLGQARKQHVNLSAEVLKLMKVYE
jgi:hypothetical protein